MAKIKLNGDTSGYIEISAPAVSGNNTLELGPGTKILTNLDNTFTGVSTFSSDVYLGNDIYLTDGSSGHEQVEVDSNDIRVTGKHIHSQFGVWTRSASVNNRRNGIDGDNNDLLLYANSAEKLRIKSDGDVYIGNIAHSNDGGANSSYRTLTLTDTTNGAQLHLRGQSPKLYLDVTSGGNGEIYYDTGDLRILSGEPGSAGSTERLRITSGGQMGLGTNDPNSYGGNVKLAVANTSGTCGLSIVSATNGDGNLYYADGTSGDATYRGYIRYNHTTDQFRIGVAGAEKVRITSDGDVGINQNSPTRALSVYDGQSSVNTVIRVGTNASSSTTDGYAQVEFKHGSASSAWIWHQANSTTGFGGANSLNFYNGHAADYAFFSGGNNERFRIDSSGRITKPNQPAFSVRRNSSQDIPHNTNTKIQWNTEIFDVGGHFDSSTNFRFTAPVAGKYLFLGHLYIYSTRQVEAKIYKNGSVYKRFSGPLGTGGNDNPNGMDFMDIVDLSVNDYIEIFGYHYRDGDTNTVSIYGGNLKETSFVGYFLG